MSDFYPRGIALHEKLQRLAIEAGECPLTMGDSLHRLAAGRKLILAGVEVESEVGPVGHSDADVVLHAVMPTIAAHSRIVRNFPMIKILVENQYT